MFKKKQISIVLAAAMLVSMPVSANVGQGMNDLFNSVGGFANTTPPTAYKSQTMNGFSGGSFYMRTPVKTYQLATMQAPSLNIGCGGIDLTAGSFSFINKDALIGLFRNIGTSLSYAFLLAIKSSMPEMASLFEKLQDVANKINGMQINSCELAQGIVTKGGAGVSASLSSSFSQLGGSITNLFSDPLASKEATKDNAAEQNRVKDATIAADPSKEELLKPGNVVWRALNQVSNLDTQDKEFLMSLSGTVIIREPSGSGANSKAPNWDYIPPTIDDVDGVVGPQDPNIAAKITIYKCDTTATNGCLNMTPSTITTTSFTQMVSRKIENLKGNITTRTPQNIADFALVDMASIPVWRLISASTDINSDLVDKYKRLIAYDVAYEYIQDMLALIKRVTKKEEFEAPSQDAQDALKRLTDGLSDLENKLHRKRIAEATNVQKAVEIEREIQFLVQTMNAAIPAQAFNSMQLFK